MRRLGPFLGLVLLVVATIGGCAKETYLVVNFDGPAEPAVHYIALQLLLTPPADGGRPQQTADEVPPANKRPGPIKFPAKMAFILDERGELSINAEARAQAGAAVAHGMAKTTIREGETWQIDLRLTAP